MYQFTVVEQDTADIICTLTIAFKPCAGECVFWDEIAYMIGLVCYVEDRAVLIVKRINPMFVHPSGEVGEQKPFDWLQILGLK